MNKTFICAALAGIISAGVAMSAQADDAMGKEKCYGITKAGKNECKSANASHSCAGQATKDNDPNDWKLATKSDCDAAGGSMQAPK